MGTRVPALQTTGSGMPAGRAPAGAQPAHALCTKTMRVQYRRQTQAPTAAGRDGHQKGGLTCAKDVCVFASIRGRTRGVRVVVSAEVARFADETLDVAARRPEAVFHRFHRASDNTREAQRRVGGLDGGGALPRTRDLLLALDAY